MPPPGRRYELLAKGSPYLNLTAIDSIVREINQEVANIKNRTRAGVEEAANLIKTRAQELTPIDTGALKKGAYIKMIDTESGPAAEIGFAPIGSKPAKYAVYVHEIMENYHPIGQAKFLEIAVKWSAGDVLEIIRRRAAK